VTIEDLGTLKRKMTVTVPLEKVKEAYDKCYLSLKDKIKINGFRKGKVPRSMIEKRYKDLMQNETVEGLVPEYFSEAVKQINLRPAGRPHFEDLTFDKNKPLVFSASFEIFPDIEIPNFGLFQLEKTSIAVTPEEIEEQKQRHLEYAATYPPKNGPADKPDRIKFDVIGRVGDEILIDFKDRETIIGQNQLYPGFDDYLIGTVADEEKSFDLTFPSDYHEEKLSGKTVRFSVKIQTVSEKRLPEIDETFLARYGARAKTAAEFQQLIENETRFRKEEQLRRERHNNIRQKLWETLDFEVPEQLLKEEVQIRINQAKQQGQTNLSVEELETQARQEAIKHMRFAILIQKILDQEKMQIDTNAVNQRFAMNCAMLGIKPEELIQQEYGKQIYQETRSMLTEEMVLDFIIDKALAL